MSLASRSVVSALRNGAFTESATIKRRTTEGVWRRGIFVESAPVETATSVIAAPVEARVRETLPEGLRESKLLTFYVVGTLTAVKDGESAGDEITYANDTYRIVSSHEWDGFTEAVGQKVS